MDNVSRPLIALLVGTAAFFALWIVALRPSTATTSGQSQAGGLSGYQSAITAAHNAVKTSDKASVAHGGTVASTPASTSTVAAKAPARSAPVAAATSHTRASRTDLHRHAVARHHRSAPVSARDRVALVNSGLEHHRVIALLFYNPAGTDDRAVKGELASVPTHHGRVLKLAVPIAELARYPVVSTQVPVTESPTLVLIDAQRQASTIEGFTDRFEIAVRVSQALAVN